MAKIPYCDYCIHFEECIFGNNPKECDAVYKSEIFNFMEWVECKDWIELFEELPECKKNPYQALVDFFEDEIATDEQQMENLDGDMLKKINRIILNCKTNEELAEKVEIFLIDNDIKYKFELGRFESEKNGL